MLAEIISGKKRDRLFEAADRRRPSLKEISGRAERIVCGHAPAFGRHTDRIFTISGLEAEQLENSRF